MGVKCRIIKDETDLSNIVYYGEWVINGSWENLDINDGTLHLFPNTENAQVYVKTYLKTMPWKKRPKIIMSEFEV